MMYNILNWIKDHFLKYVNLIVYYTIKVRLLFLNIYSHFSKYVLNFRINNNLIFKIYNNGSIGLIYYTMKMFYKLSTYHNIFYTVIFVLILLICI